MLKKALVMGAVALGLAYNPAAFARDYISIVGSSTVYPFATTVAEHVNATWDDLLDWLTEEPAEDFRGTMRHPGCLKLERLRADVLYEPCRMPAVRIGGLGVAAQHRNGNPRRFHFYVRDV